MLIRKSSSSSFRFGDWNSKTTNDLIKSALVNSDISDVTVSNNILPKVRSSVPYHYPDNNSWNRALIISRTGKGKNNPWLNVQDITQDKRISIDFNKIKGWKNIEEVLIAITSDNNVEILEAKQAELNSWVKHNVYEEIADRGKISNIQQNWLLAQRNLKLFNILD